MSEKLFFLNGKRAMVSLGPLTKIRHCPYQCAFCYVQYGFNKYATLDEDEIMNFQKKNRDNYYIIYISGDTDSFAAPRTDKALSLLKRMTFELDVDLLFTTRTTFSNEHYEILKQIAEEQQRTNNKLYACISITRYSDAVDYIEPAPIPSPDERIQTIINLKQIGATTVLALRPFLPVVDVKDYITIIDKTIGYVDIVLGECFYFIRNGKIYKRVFKNGFQEQWKMNTERGVLMRFDDNTLKWDVWDSKEYQDLVRKHCEKNGIIFSMHSDDAIAEYKCLDNSENI